MTERTDQGAAPPTTESGLRTTSSNRQESARKHVAAPAAAKRTLVVVLGMHRSGTSVITRGLQAHGIGLGDNLMPPMAGNNDKGFFEDLDLFRFNDRLLAKADSAWHQLAPLDPAALNGRAFSVERREASALLSDKLSIAGGLFAFKDPRTCVLMPLWRSVFEDLDLDDRYVIAIRHPLESAASLEARDGIHLTKGVLLWAKHIINAIEHTADKTRVLVRYDSMLSQPRETLAHIANTLGLDISSDTQAEVNDFCSNFMEHGLRHQLIGKEELRRSGVAPDFIVELYDLILQMARSDTPPPADLWRSIVDRFNACAPLLTFADDIDAERVRATASLAAATAQGDAAASLLEQAQLEAARAQAAWQLELDGARAALAATQADADAANAHLAATQAQAAAAQARLLADIQAVCSDLEAAQARAIELSEALAVSTSRSERLSQALGAEQTALAALRAEAVRNATAARALAKDLATANNEKLALAYEIEIQRAALQAARVQAAEESKATAALETRLRDAARIASEQRLSQLAAAKQGAEQERDALRAEIQAINAEHQRLQQMHASAGATLAETSAALSRAESELSTLRMTSTRSETQRRELRKRLLQSRAEIAQMRRSISWRITKPLRALGRFSRRPFAYIRPALAKVGRFVWHCIPLPPAKRGKLAIWLFSTFPSLFFWSNAYRAWRNARATVRPSNLPTSPAEPTENTEYVPLSVTTPPRQLAARAIAFYLPQFHPIKENNEWWGEGFTEWTKVRPATPRFSGHYQPHIPDDTLGYYDLAADRDVMRKQAEIAKLHGVSGFCFYFYWFGGKTLLETPLRNFLQDSGNDMPFCLCWANENWSRRWDGRDNEILIGQQHSAADDIAFIQHVSQYIADPRYIRIGNRPLLVVYRPSLLPDAKATAQRWRTWLRANGFGEVYLATTHSFDAVDPAEFGFDAAIEFPPNNSELEHDAAAARALGAPEALRLYDWRKLAERAYSPPAYKLFRGVTPSWDNTARRPKDGAILLNSTPTAFETWLTRAVHDTQQRFENPDERLIFINAWNEWAEGAHLEPDKRYGFAWLNATRRALANDPKIIIVTHDMLRHGAQYIALNIARALRHRFGVEIATLAGGDGPLDAEFAKLGDVSIITDQMDPSSRDMILKGLAGRGFKRAIVNSAASAWLAPALARQRIESVGLVHELTGMIRSRQFEGPLRALDDTARAVVFPATKVRDDGATAIGLPRWRNPVVLPQGLYKTGTLADWSEKEVARQRIVSRFDLPYDARIVLGVGYGDHRKGVDIFVEWAQATAERWPNTYFIWIGEFEVPYRRVIDRHLEAHPAAHVLLPGFVEGTRDLYLASDLYALSSREDPFPSTALEALAAATPVIMIKGAGGIEDLSAHGCVTAVDGSADSFVAAAAPYFENAEHRQAVGLRGRDLIRAEFGSTSYAARIAELAGVDIPNISVVVPNFNYAHCLPQRLESILNQTLSPREIIFLDDASSDDSIAVAERVLRNASVNWRIVRNTQNSGSVFAQWRKGVAMAKGDLVWIAEADDWADPHFLETAAAAFKRRDVVLSFTQSQQVDAEGRVLSPHYLEYVRDVSRDKWTRAFVSEGTDEIREGLSIKNTIPNASGVLFHRRTLLDVLEQQDVDIRSYRVAGDWCVYVNMLRHGALAFAPEALNYHRRHDASVTISRFGLRELSELARMQAYVAREFGVSAERAQQGRLYLETLVAQFELPRQFTPEQIEDALRGVVH